MTADVADAKTDEGSKKRGGQRGERPWRDKPTARERVMNQNLAEYVKEVTGKDVSPETIRAVRFGLPKWSNADSTKALRENMDKKLEKAKLQDKREKALAMLKEAESELSKYDSAGDLEDEDEDEDDEDESFDESDSDDSDESDDDDVFGD
ncbi:methyltransferase [Mycobacterium phage Cuke]|uniref:Uncharacterized protein n=1 Tax=Mycobacterium phage Cuke TaxID=2079417 RepID=A0A2L1IWX7_9CAUD|nr:methyltransferase [Mycobacterium phage Cuke]AVD99691.1 hypothetical protein SEA_CUKE_75 [Mycobacterium phage Cuke]